MPHEFQITRRVEFSETDMAGLMHFSNYFRFMEAAEHAFFRSLGYSVVLTKNDISLHLPRVHAECHFRAPLRFEDEVRIQLLVQKKSRRSLTYQFRFYRVGDSAEREVAWGRIVVVCVKREQDGTMKAAPLPKEIADRIQESPASKLVPGTGAMSRRAAVGMPENPRRSLQSPSRSPRAPQRKPRA